MSGLPILDLVVGMIFIFFLLSVICSSAVELVLSVLRTRARLLEEWLITIFDKAALDSKGNIIFKQVKNKSGEPEFEQEKDEKGNLVFEEEKDKEGNLVLDENNLPKTKPKFKTVSVGQAIMDHCIARALSSTGKSPSYINTENFVSALLDKITIPNKTEPIEKNLGGTDAATKGAGSPVQPSANFPATSSALLTDSEGHILPPDSLDKYITAIKQSTVISGELKRTFLALAYEAKNAAEVIPDATKAAITTQIKSGLDHFRERLEVWYNKNQERLTGKFKSSWVLPATFIIATLITLLLNADSIAISRYLYTNKEASKQLSDQALAYMKKNGERIEQARKNIDTTKIADSAEAVKRLDNIATQVKQDIKYFTDSLPANLPLGWKNEKRILKDNTKDVDWIGTFFNSAGNHGIGWLVSILAICLGAPFWYDILNKIANLRSNGPRPPTDKEEKK